MKRTANPSTENTDKKTSHSSLVRSPKKERGSRTGPKGKKAIVSDEAVESIARNMEERTKLAIQKIGRSIGF